MDSDTLEFTQVLKLDNVELYDYISTHSSLTSKGPLEVLFNKDMNLVILKFHNFRYALDRTLKITASSDDEKHFRSYLLPHVGGCYLLKVGIPSFEPIVANFETIIENSCQLERNPDLNTHLKAYAGKEGIFRRGETLLKEAYIKSSSLVSKGVDTLIHRGHANPNHSLIRKIEEIRMTSKEESSFVTWLRKEVIELLESSNEFSKRQDEGFWNHFGEISQGTSLPASSEQLKEGESGSRNETETTDASKTASASSLEEKTTSKPSLIEKAKETISHLTHKSAKAEFEEDTPEHRAEIGKVLRRENELTDLSEMTFDDRTRLQKLKEGVGNLASKITGHVEVKEEDKVLLRSDNFTDIGEMPYLPVDKKTSLTKLSEKGHALVDKAKESLSGFTSKITGHSKDVKEEVSQKTDELENKTTEAEGVKTPVVEQVKELTRKVSQSLEEYRDSGDLSSETTIEPNREGPSALDKINEEYGKVVDTVVDTVEEVAEQVVETVTETKPEEPAKPQVEEKGKSILGSVKESIHNVSSKLSQGVGSFKGKFKKEGAVENEGEASNEEVENREGTEEFREVKEGFSETVEELRHEQGADIVVKSDNVFEQLAGEGTAESAEEGQQQVEGKSLVSKVKEGLNTASSNISGKITETKEKIKSVFVHPQPDKENAPQSTSTA